MKNKKIIFVLVLLAAAAVGIKYFFSLRHIDVVKGSALMENNNQWNRIISDYVNEKGIKVTVDGSTAAIGEGNVYMDANRNMLVSHEVLTSMFSCSANLYDTDRLVVEKGSNILELRFGKTTSVFNGKEEELTVKPVLKNSVLYISLKALCQKLSYEYEWDYETNTVLISNSKPDEKIFPYRYDYRENGKITTVRNQANLGTCWAFASLTALSTTLLPEAEYDFSPDHMSFNTGYSFSRTEGGDYTMAMAYLAAWKGPVLEEDDPYGDGVTTEGLDAVVHVQEMQILESKNYDKIKKAVFLYGGVQSSLYMSTHDADGKGSQFYNAESSAYCYVGTEKANHDIVIVGWDDSYAADNFATVPEGDGAFVCVNSWGEQFGEGGYFYVSYYDSNIGIYNVVYTKAESPDNYDNIYQSDLLGWVGQIGYNRENAYFANVYESAGTETLEAVGFYATGANTEYEIYVVENFEDESSFVNKNFVKKGIIANAGYYTIELDTPVLMTHGRKTAVIINIKTSNSQRPVAIEYDSGREGCTIDVTDGEGYISANGRVWERVETGQKCNVCLKFYTNDVKKEGN